MIGMIRGKVVESGLTEVIVDVNGVGWQIFIPMSTYDKLPAPGGETCLLTNLVVREDSLRLYGFATKSEKELFEILMDVSGIGPKLALNVLSSMPVSSFCMAVASADLKVLSRINGIGKKTGERIILELKDKISKIITEITPLPKVADDKARAAEDAVLALEQLGFKRDKAYKTVLDLAAEMDAKDCTSEVLIRKALKSLNS